MTVQGVLLFKRVGTLEGVVWSKSFSHTKDIVLHATDLDKLATLEQWDLKWYLLMGVSLNGKSPWRKVKA